MDGNISVHRSACIHNTRFKTSSVINQPCSFFNPALCLTISCNFKSFLFLHLLVLVNNCWDNQHVLGSWYHGFIQPVTLLYATGTMALCNLYHGFMQLVPLFSLRVERNHVMKHFVSWLSQRCLDEHSWVYSICSSFFLWMNNTCFGS